LKKEPAMAQFGKRLRRAEFRNHEPEFRREAKGRMQKALALILNSDY
jgi:hypothetical protein